MQIPSPTSPTLEQAVAAQLAGQMLESPLVYEQVLQEDPIHPVALHYYGIWLHQAGRHDEALQKLVLSCALVSDNADWHNDLGNVFFALGSFEEAEHAYREALAITPREHSLWSNLGATLRQQDKLADAADAFRQALEIDADFVPALLHLGAIYEAQGDKRQASYFQCRAYVLPPHDGKSAEMLAISFYFLGRLDQAAAAYGAWLAQEPGHPVAAHMLAACSQQDIPGRASDHYLEFHFDRYADTFDTNLMDSLGYRGPHLIGQGLERAASAARQFDTVDIGCGTGLCGTYLAPYSRHVTGVDLAGKMLEKAAATGHYACLEKQEAGQYLATRPQAFDLVAAADTLIYFGDLAPLLHEVAQSLRDGGHFIFTIESLSPAEDPTSSGFCLHASGRYRHSDDHVRHNLARNGLTVLHLSTELLRHEAALPVEGRLFVARKTSQ